MWIKYDDVDFKRWYKESVKEPNIGESIKVITDLYEEEGVEVGSLHRVEHKNEKDVMVVVNDNSIFLHSTEYVTLEKTDIILVNGKEYKEVDSVRYPGEIIIAKRSNQKKGFIAGQVLEVLEIKGEMLSARDNETGEVFNIWQGEYVAIQPVLKEGSIERRILDKFEEAEKAILASDIPLEEAFDLILKFRDVRERQRESLQ